MPMGNLERNSGDRLVLPMANSGAISISKLLRFAAAWIFVTVSLSLLICMIRDDDGGSILSIYLGNPGIGHVGVDGSEWCHFGGCDG